MKGNEYDRRGVFGPKEPWPEMICASLVAEVEVEPVYTKRGARKVRLTIPAGPWTIRKELGRRQALAFARLLEDEELEEGTAGDVAVRRMVPGHFEVETEGAILDVTSMQVV